MFDLDTVFKIAIGAAGVVALYLLYLAKTKGVPAAIAWVKARWNAGKADLESLQGDVAGVQTKLASIETVALADITKRLSALEGSVASLKQTPAAAAPSAAPAGTA